MFKIEKPKSACVVFKGTFTLYSNHFETDHCGSQGLLAQPIQLPWLPGAQSYKDKHFGGQNNTLFTNPGGGTHLIF